MLESPVARLIIHAVFAGIVAAVAAASASASTRDIVLAFIGGLAAFGGYGAVSPTYKGVGVGKDGNDANLNTPPGYMK